MKNIIIIILLFVNTVFSIEEIDPVIGSRSFDITFISSTNMTVKSLKQPQSVYRYNFPEIELKIHDELTLTPDYITNIGFSMYRSFMLIPVLYKNQLKGFQILELDGNDVSGTEDGDWGGLIIDTNSIHYVALSDTPLKVEEDDVEMIMVYNKWQLFKPIYFTNAIHKPYDTIEYTIIELLPDEEPPLNSPPNIIYRRTEKMFINNFNESTEPPAPPAPPFSEKIKPYVVPICKWFATDKYIWRSVVLFFSVSWLIYRIVRKRK